MTTEPTTSRAPDRRDFLRGTLGAGALLAMPARVSADERSTVAERWARPGAFAERLAKPTPSFTEGPFYPDHLPLDTDNDLLVLNDALTPAVGTVAYLSGRILTEGGAPLRNCYVEIWQCDNKGSYVHSDGEGPDGRDDNFQGYGRFLTDAQGRYFFRTIRPVAYGTGSGFRTPHIHFALSKNGKRVFTTQMFVAGDPNNERDSLLERLTDPDELAMVMATFRPVSGSEIGELEADWDVVIGRTLEELDDGTIGGGVAKRRGAGEGGRRR